MFWSTRPKILDDCETTEERGMVKINKMWFQWWSPACQKGEDQVQLPPDLPTAAAGCWQADPCCPSSVWPQLTFSLLISELFISIAICTSFHCHCQLPTEAYEDFQSFTFPFLKQFKCFQLRGDLHISRNSIFKLQTWGLSNWNVDLGSQYLYCRPGVSVFELQTWGISIWNADLGSHYWASRSR